MDSRFGGDPAVRDRFLTEYLYPVRDTVLDKARLQPGDTVLDVGTLSSRWLRRAPGGNGRHTPIWPPPGTSGVSR